jgi:hypothetical protein
MNDGSYGEEAIIDLHLNYRCLKQLEDPSLIKLRESPPFEFGQ